MWQNPQVLTHTGTHVVLRAPDIINDGAALFDAGHRTSAHLYTWQYLPYGPFNDCAAMDTYVRDFASKTDPLMHIVCDAVTHIPIGVITIMSIFPEFGRVELGHIWYDADIQRTPRTTESAFLLLTYLFDTLHYRRIEWKCDANNARSRSAAIRLGFRFEGVFQQHLIVKGRNRDTAWFAICDHEWSVIRTRFEQYFAGTRRHLGR
ncbi:MAG: GNAT family protein [Chloroflexales bacterium]|nr:GNAT family protein [Chloroflexales bacterium]